MAVLTGLTVQDTRGVFAVRPLPAPFVLSQFRALAADVNIAGVKVGMLGSRANLAAAARILEDAAGSPRIGHWEISNEPDFDLGHAGGETPPGGCFGGRAGDYARYLRVAVRRFPRPRNLAFQPDLEAFQAVLRDLEDFDIAETARTLGCSAIAVRVHLSKARRKLAEVLRRDFPHLEEGQ